MRIVYSFIFIIMSIFTITAQEDIIYPAPLQEGDKVAILSPAGPIDSAIVYNAALVLRDMGFDPIIYPHTFGKNGHFSGTTEERLADLTEAFGDPEIRAIFCSRGGYGVVHNLGSLGQLDLQKDPKWVIGFSDISALHALMASQGIASVHSSMAKQIALGLGNADNYELFSILRGHKPVYTFEPHPYNRSGEATGRLVGGNLAVLAGLINTPFDIFPRGSILFIEDVSEPIYKIERILYQLKLSGVLSNIKGLIIGQFTDYRPDENHECMEDMIREMVAEYDIPIAFNVPVGHVDHNVPLIESSVVTLRVTTEHVDLITED